MACNNNSPTAPSMTGGFGITVNFDDPGNALGTQHALIRELIESAFQSASPQIPIEGVTVTVMPGPQRVVPGWGAGGFAADAGNIEIGIDPGQPDSLIAQRLPSIVAHELHHVARYRGLGYGSTLLEAMASEGLADHFAQELYSEPLPPWVTALSDSEIDRWTVLAKPELDSSSYSHAAWFFGSGTVPQWAGYAIGFALVSDYQADHGNPSAATLVHTDANAFRPN